MKKRLICFFLWFVHVRVCSSSRNKLVQLESRPTNIMQVPNESNSRPLYYKTCRHSEPNKAMQGLFATSMGYVSYIWVAFPHHGYKLIIVNSSILQEIWELILQRIIKHYKHLQLGTRITNNERTRMRPHEMIRLIKLKKIQVKF